MSKQLEPFCARYNLTQEKQKDEEKDDATTETHTSSAKAEILLQPIEQFVEQKELEQAGKTALTIIAHVNLQRRDER